MIELIKNIPSKRNSLLYIGLLVFTYYVLTLAADYGTPVVMIDSTTLKTSRSTSLMTSTSSTTFMDVDTRASSQMSSQMSSAVSMFVSSYNSKDTKPNWDTTTTTLLNYELLAYRMRIPEKYVFCNPLTYKAANGTVLKEPDKCLAIDETCCSCENFGGRIQPINERFYPEYYSNYLHNCTGFPVVCKTYNSGLGCRYFARCFNGRCILDR